MAIWSAITFVIWIFLGFLVVLVVIGALSQMFGKTSGEGKPGPYDERTWKGDSPNNPIRIKRSELRKSTSSSRVDTASSPRQPNSSRPELPRQLSAPSGQRVGGELTSPRSIANHVIPDRSSSSSSSVFEKARKTWLLTADSKDLQGFTNVNEVQLQQQAQEEKPQQEEDAILDENNEILREPVSPTSPLLRKTSFVNPPPSSSSRRASPFITSVLLSSLTLFAYTTTQCFDLSSSPPKDRLSCPFAPLNPSVYSLLYSSALGFCHTRDHLVAASANLTLFVTKNSESKDSLLDSVILRQFLIVSSCIGALAICLGLVVKLSTSKPPSPTMSTLAPLRVDLDGTSPRDDESSSPAIMMMAMQQVDFASMLCHEMEHQLGLEVYRADPKGVQIPENINLDNLEQSLVFVLAISREGAYSRESCLMELKLALERQMPVIVLFEPNAKINGPSEFVQLVKQQISQNKQQHMTWDAEQSPLVLQQIKKIVDSHSVSNGVLPCWQVFVSHAIKNRVDSGLFRPLSPINERSISAPVSTVRDSLAVLVAHVNDKESVSAMSCLIVSQVQRGYLASEEGGVLLAVLRAKNVLDCVGHGPTVTRRLNRIGSSNSVLEDPNTAD